MKIVCGTDFSENAAHAAEVAAALARRQNGQLLLVHAHGKLIEGSIPQAHEEVIAGLRKQLHQEADRLRQLGATVEEVLGGGAAEDVLVRIAQQRHADLLIVSSLGLRGAARIILGSVAERAAEAAPVPTLVVRDPAPLIGWASGARTLKILVGTDFTQSSDDALHWIAHLRKMGPCEVVAAYIDRPSAERRRLGLEGKAGLTTNRPDLQTLLERDLREKVVRIMDEKDVRIVVHANTVRVEEQLVQLAIEAQSDLIVSGAHQRHGLSRLWHGSVSRGILHEAPMSVACVPTITVGAMAVPRIHQCRRVLVAADLGGNHGFAAPYAYSIVEAGGTVHLVHVIEPYQFPSSLIGGYYQNYLTKDEHSHLVEQCKAGLRALVPAEVASRGITTEVEVIEDAHEGKAICAAAERCNADVVCVGGHARPSFAAKILGSIALDVLTHSRRPVLIAWPPGGG